MALTEILRYESTACPNELCEIRKQVGIACKKLGFAQPEIDAITLAIDEACTNIIRHAYANCKNGHVLLQVLTDGEHAIFRLHDNAKKVPKDCLQVKKKDLHEPGGLGIMLMRQIMDWVGFVHTAQCKGNILELKKKLPKKPDKDAI